MLGGLPACAGFVGGARAEGNDKNNGKSNGKKESRAFGRAERLRRGVIVRAEALPFRFESYLAGLKRGPSEIETESEASRRETGDNSFRLRTPRRACCEPEVTATPDLPTATSTSAVRKLEPDDEAPLRPEVPAPSQSERRTQRRSPAEDSCAGRHRQPPQGRGDHPRRPRAGERHRGQRAGHAARSATRTTSAWMASCSTAPSSSATTC